MIYGYARISTSTQNIERQLRNILAEYPTAKIYQEAYSGRTTARPEYDKLKKNLKAGDVVVFDAVSRMSRNADEGVSDYMELFNMGVDLVFLKEHYIDTAVYKEAKNGQIDLSSNAAADGKNNEDLLSLVSDFVNNVLLLLAEQQIRAAFEQSQKEVDDLRQRTREGIETARRAGKVIGHERGAELTTLKSLEAKKIILINSRTFGGSLKDADCQKVCGIVRNSFYKYKREIIAELNAEPMDKTEKLKQLQAEIDKHKARYKK